MPEAATAATGADSNRGKISKWRKRFTNIYLCLQACVSSTSRSLADMRNCRITTIRAIYSRFWKGTYIFPLLSRPCHRPSGSVGRIRPRRRRWARRGYTRGCRSSWSIGRRETEVEGNTEGGTRISAKFLFPNYDCGGDFFTVNVYVHRP